MPLCLWRDTEASSSTGVMCKVFQCFPGAICEVLTSRIICVQVLAVLNYRLQMKRLPFFFFFFCSSSPHLARRAALTPEVQLKGNEAWNWRWQARRPLPTAAPAPAWCCSDLRTAMDRCWGRTKRRRRRNFTMENQNSQIFRVFDGGKEKALCVV